MPRPHREPALHRDFWFRARVTSNSGLGAIPAMSSDVHSCISGLTLSQLGPHPNEVSRFVRSLQAGLRVSTRTLARRRHGFMRSDCRHMSKKSNSRYQITKSPLNKVLDIGPTRIPRVPTSASNQAQMPLSPTEKLSKQYELGR